MTEEDSNYLEKHFYEMNGLLIVVSQYGSDSKWKPDVERFNLVLDKYLNKYAEVEIIKNHLIQKYGIDNSVYKVDFNFTDQEMILTLDDSQRGVIT